MQLNDVKRNTKRQYGQSVGRGGKRGKTSGRGTKGQKARAGHKIRPEIRDVIMRLPKLRGYRFKSRFSPATPVNLAKLDAHFASGDTVSADTLLEKGLIKRFAGAVPTVKILSNGELTKKITVKGCLVSAQARAKIEKAGGAVSA
jgi:large subunit ribosomal protein L15